MDGQRDSMFFEINYADLSDSKSHNKLSVSYQAECIPILLLQSKLLPFGECRVSFLFHGMVEVDLVTLQIVHEDTTKCRIYDLLSCHKHSAHLR